jgi:hypothetical protein
MLGTSVGEVWGSHGGEGVHMGCDAVRTCRQAPTSGRNVLPVYSGLKRPSALKMEAVRSPETMALAWESIQRAD